MTTPPDYGRAFGLWREETGEAWRTYTEHAFVEGLREGTLPRSAFLHYLKQDYLFLVHFSRAWALAVVKSETLEEMKVASATVNALVNHEMQLHVETCAAEGLTEEALFGAEEASENLAYTRYVLEAGYSGDFLDLMAALAPCVLGYGEIGARLGTSRGEHESPYDGWIDTYAGASYQQICRDVGALIDEALKRRLGGDFHETPRWPRLTSRFATATRLEAAFWDMGLRGA